VQNSRKRKIDSSGSLVVHCCVIKKNVIVASQLYDITNVQFTVEKQGLLELLQFIQKYYLGNFVPNLVKCCGFSLPLVSHLVIFRPI